MMNRSFTELTTTVAEFSLACVGFKFFKGAEFIIVELCSIFSFINI